MDQFCKKHWMMHVGDEKGLTLSDTLKKYQPKTILELGCYCGYSALLMALHSNATVHTFDINPAWNVIASKILEHAGMSNRVNVYDGTIQQNEESMKKNSPFDLVFMDHDKPAYLTDLLWL